MRYIILESKIGKQDTSIGLTGTELYDKNVCVIMYYVKMYDQSFNFFLRIGSYQKHSVSTKLRLEFVLMRLTFFICVVDLVVVH